tara:strand:+ start:133 stop:546 length:414 start_codon:yes stop_codon:yes gene_type:complete
MVIARSVNETFSYVCKADRALDASLQTTFRLRRLPSTVGIALDNLHEGNADGQVTLKVGDQKMVALMAGIDGWENFNDAEGNQVEFKRNAGERSVFGVIVKNPALRSMIDHLPPDIADELAAVIREENTVSEDDLKN